MKLLTPSLCLGDTYITKYIHHTEDEKSLLLHLNNFVCKHHIVMLGRLKKEEILKF